MHYLISITSNFHLFFQASSKVEVDPEATEKIKVCREDFLHALEFDIKPVSNNKT